MLAAETMCFPATTTTETAGSRAKKRGATGSCPSAGRTTRTSTCTSEMEMGSSASDEMTNYARHTRRDFLCRTAALGIVGTAGRWIPPARAQQSETATLHAKPGTARLAPADYPETPVWGYDGKVPGPTIRVPQGATVSRRFLNGLPQGSTVHWHGVRLENPMDGVPELTQPVVEPADDFLYDFTVPDTGTYWYHPHERAWEQMARGLYGALVVEEPEPPQVDRDEVLLIDDWRLAQDASIDESFGALGDWSHGGRTGNWITVNGEAGWSLRVGQYERLRLRLVNVANARIFSLAANGLDGWLVALDGQPLGEARPAGPIVLAPGQRADILIDAVAEPGSQAVLYSRERESSFVLATFTVEGTARNERLPAPTALASNPVPPHGSLAEARRATLHMEGGAMGGMREARMGGRMVPMRELAQAGKLWAFNGDVEMSEKPLFAAERGEAWLVRIVNDTAWPHAMHLHGHHFRPVGSDGNAGPLRDTLLVDSEQTVQIGFVADNPGDWLLHCHTLEHSIAGMRTWFRVT